MQAVAIMASCMQLYQTLPPHLGRETGTGPGLCKRLYACNLDSYPLVENRKCCK